MQSTIRRLTTTGPFRSLRCYSSSPQPMVRLICFPWCGAAASAYRRFAATLPDRIELWSVQLPGREDRFSESKLSHMEQVVEHVITDVVALFDKPLVLFGHSMGGLIAYEMALALQDRGGSKPYGLIISGCAAPGMKKESDKCWHTADDAKFIANLRQLGGTPSTVLEDAQMMRVLTPMLRADYQVLESYQHKPEQLLSCSVFVCAGKNDAEVSHASIHAWQRHSSRQISVHWFEGDHFYLCAHPQALTQRLNEWILGMKSVHFGAL